MPRAVTNKIKSVRAVDRAIEILKCFSVEKPSMSVLEIQKKVRLSRPTLYRLLHTLTEKGLVRADGEPQRFSLDYGVAQLGHVWMSALNVTAAAEPIVMRLRDQTSETSALYILRGDLRACVLEMTSQHILSITQGVGRSEHVSRGASGKAILAFMSEEQSASAMRSLPPATDRKRLIEHLVKVRKDGFALSRGEIVVGAVAIAAPFFDRSGCVAGSIRVAGPEARVDEDWIARSAKLLVASASELSVALGSTTLSQTGNASNSVRDRGKKMKRLAHKRPALEL
jgi:IclR family transcriptional regulator, acetate operon repressor